MKYDVAVDFRKDYKFKVRVRFSKGLPGDFSEEETYEVSKGTQFTLMFLFTRATHMVCRVCQQDNLKEIIPIAKI